MKLQIVLCEWCKQSMFSYEDCVSPCPHCGVDQTSSTLRPPSKGSFKLLSPEVQERVTRVRQQIEELDDLINRSRNLEKESEELAKKAERMAKKMTEWDHFSFVQDEKGKATNVEINRTPIRWWMCWIEWLWQAAFSRPFFKFGGNTNALRIGITGSPLGKQYRISGFRRSDPDYEKPVELGLEDKSETPWEEKESGTLAKEKEDK